MALKKDKILKKYYSIGEVSEQLGIPESTLRYWEKEFKEISPKKTKGGKRQYTEADIEQVKLVNHLVKEKALTIKGARDRMKKNPAGTKDVHEIVSRLKSIREKLMSIYKELDSIPPCGQPL
ncbi:MAG: MerR family transcriptional regulator [Bacteroidaceae bacterium]|nr:MerR family transcriptional regulator [Bacteroidaceae bacterium]